MDARCAEQHGAQGGRRRSNKNPLFSFTLMTVPTSGSQSFDVLRRIATASVPCSPTSPVLLSYALANRAPRATPPSLCPLTLRVSRLSGAGGEGGSGPATLCFPSGQHTSTRSGDTKEYTGSIYKEPTRDSDTQLRHVSIHASTTFVATCTSSHRPCPSFPLAFASKIKRGPPSARRL